MLSTSSHSSVLYQAWLLGLLLMLPSTAFSAGRGAAIDQDEVIAWGTAFSFSIEGGYVVGGEVTILERPDLGTAITDERGGFEFGGLIPGEEATFLLTAPGFHPTQTGTHIIPESGLPHMNFQAPPDLIFQAFTLWLRSFPSPRDCQVASTVVRAGASPYEVPHGLGGATVSITPDGAYDEGPIYFQYLSDDIIVPVYYLDETTVDGGVLFLNLEPGDYTLRAHKEGETFSDAKIRCRAGVLVNAAPPYGLQALPNEWE